MQTVALDYARAYTTYGDRARPTIVFVHGIRLGRDIWDGHARALANDYHVVTMDLPGHGALAHVPFTAATIGALFDHVFREVCSAKPLIVGYSLGGYAAMEYGESHPERSAGLLLAGCTLDFETWKRWPYELSVRLSQMLPTGLLNHLMWWSLHLTLPRIWADLVSAIPFNRAVFEQTSAITHERRLFSYKLAAYTAPVLFVNGEYDFVFRLDERRFLQRIPHARLKIVRRVDHTMPMRRANEFVTIVREFADRVFGRNSSAGPLMDDPTMETF